MGSAAREERRERVCVCVRAPKHGSTFGQALIPTRGREKQGARSNRSYHMVIFSFFFSFHITSSLCTALYLLIALSKYAACRAGERILLSMLRSIMFFFFANRLSGPLYLDITVMARRAICCITCILFDYFWIGLLSLLCTYTLSSKHMSVISVCVVAF